MTTTEFSQAFDTLIAAYNDTIAYGESYNKIAFDEYEKSVFLTKAQDELVISFYSGRNSYNEGFESTEEIRRYLSPLVVTAEQPELTGKDIEKLIKVNKNSHFFALPDDIWFVTYEALKLSISNNPCTSEKFIEVVPITQDELHRILKNPFRGINSHRAIRLDVGENKVEIIYSTDTVDNYTVRYIKEPSPIILENLSNETKIKGLNNVSECFLHPALHKAILDRAVQLAITSKSISVGVKQ